MCTVQVSYPASDAKLKLKGGYKLIYFKSYIFGGLVPDESGQLITSNDLIEVRSR